MGDVKEMLPFLIPLIVVQLILMVIALVHIFRHDTYKRGNRVMWIIIVVAGELFGPIAYFIFGKEEE